MSLSRAARKKTLAQGGTTRIIEMRSKSVAKKEGMRLLTNREIDIKTDYQEVFGCCR